MDYFKRFNFLFAAPVFDAEDLEGVRFNQIIEEIQRSGFEMVRARRLEDAEIAVQTDAAIGCVVVDWGKKGLEGKTSALINLMRRRGLDFPIVLLIRRDRRKNLKQTRLPHLVATFRGEVVGYAYAVLFRKRPAYRYTAKHSIYVHHEQVGRGVGRRRLQELIDACAAAGFRQMIGYIDADNASSLALHEKFGFARAGLLCGVAYRHGWWSDTVMVQRSLGAGTTAPPPVTAPGR
ncbi:GNAT family N-acetyltransferase [Bradyrhizobium diazoefficiens]|nr:GNAT family N-acetyltransferase [Bradyrhizobium diazoefficiens]QQO21161.1 GNAT family N-acetyltransferase [Bradyrhizobium diazoefficiens]